MTRRSLEEDWSSFFGPKEGITNKEELISKCQKLGVPIYIDDPSETSSGVMGALRGVVSEAELQARLMALMSYQESKKMRNIAYVSLFIAILSAAISAISIFK